jgi:DNA-binding transcriptional ArsR family regulator
MKAKADERIAVEFREIILLELDYAIGAFCFERKRRYLNEEQIEIYRQIPKAWLQSASEFLPATVDFLMLFEMLALACPKAMLSADYASVSGYLRGLQAADWAAKCATTGTARISDYLMARMKASTVDLQEYFFGIPWYVQVMETTARQVEGVMSSPARQAAFWQWLDEFVYRYYLPWRARKSVWMAERTASLTSLADEEGRYCLGDLLGHLPKTNALHYRSVLQGLLRGGEYTLVMWQEPFGLFDSWSILDGEIVVSYSEPNDLFSYAKVEIEEIAEKSRALSDPTRLGILRIIRHADMDITEIANYFGISRPTVSVHIKKLREAGLVRSFDDGRSVRHQVDAEKVQALFEELEGLLDLPSPQEGGTGLTV